MTRMASKGFRVVLWSSTLSVWERTVQANLASLFMRLPRF